MHPEHHHSDFDTEDKETIAPFSSRPCIGLAPGAKGYTFKTSVGSTFFHTSALDGVRIERVGAHFCKTGSSFNKSLKYWSNTNGHYCPPCHRRYRNRELTFNIKTFRQTDTLRLAFTLAYLIAESESVTIDVTCSTIGKVDTGLVSINAICAFS